MKILISWIAFNNDFKDGKLSDESPNLAMHQYYWSYDQHIILSSSESEEKDENDKAARLRTGLTSKFKDRKDKIEIRFLGISDVIDLSLIKSKIETLLLQYKNDEIDLYISPGTPTMQVAWYLCHTSLGLKTRLLQTRPPKFSKDKSKPELIEVNLEQSHTPYTAILKENLLKSNYKASSNFLIPDILKPVYEKALKIAQADQVTTLIVGSTGTGKENLARYIHENSSRKNNSFISVNCSAFGDQLLESRLFGYKKGSFTGAEKDTPGLFKLANGGTIFLDEIGDITPYMQQSLLRVLQEKEISPVGGTAEKIDVRVISASHKNLRKLCKEEKFRWDLFYRLNVVELELPNLCEWPAKERKELINFFIDTKRKEFKKQAKLKLTKEVDKFLCDYTFPGNVRELENLIESLYVFFEDEVQVKDLPKRVFETEEVDSLNWEVVEKQLIIKALKRFKGNKTKAKEALGYGSINTLSDKIEKYAIETN